MKITLLQRDIVWADPQANMRRNDCLFTDGGADLYVFPEMFSTGFCTEPTGSPSDTWADIRSMHRDTACCISSWSIPKLPAKDCSWP